MAEKYLGYVTDKIPSSDESKGSHALMKVVAIKENGNYRKLSPEEARRHCPPNGSVFGPQFFNLINKDFYDGPFIEFETFLKQETERKFLNQTDSIINYLPRPKAINLPRLISYNGKIEKILSNGYLSPNEVNTTIDKENVFGGKDANFFLYDSIDKKTIGIFQYQSKDDKITSNYGKEVQEFTILPSDIIFDKYGRNYLLFNKNQNMLVRGSIIDFMTDQQLADWLKTKMKDVTSIDKNTLSLICQFPESQSAEDDRDASRFERLQKKAEAFKIDLQILIKLICTHTEYSKQYIDKIELIEKEVKENYEKKYFEEAPEEIKDNKEKIKLLEDEILKLGDTLRSEKEKIVAEVEREKSKLKKDNEILSKQIDERTNQLKVLNENYDSVIATISAIAPVFNAPKTATTEDVNYLYRIDFPKNEKARPYSQIKKEDDESFVSFMKRNVGFENKRLEEYLKQVKKVFTHKACFIPNAALAYFFAKALRNTEVIIMHIEHDWLHYSDYVKHGLIEVFREANDNQVKNYILVFDGLNVTQPECGLRPLLNLIHGDVPILEGSKFAFPKNITIMATVVSSSGEHAVGLKLSSEFFRKWYAVGNPVEETDKVFLPENFWNNEIITDYGYAEPSDLAIESSDLAIEPTDLPKEQDEEKTELLDNYLNF